MRVGRWGVKSEQVDGRRTRTDGLPDVLPERHTRNQADRRLLRREIWDLLSELSDPQREIIFLKDYQGHSYAEIAAIMEIPMGTVMSRLHHARKNLARILKETRHAE